MMDWIPKRKSLIFVTLYYVGSVNLVSAANETSSQHSRASPRREPRFVSFNNEGNKIGIDLDLSIPFLSIPLGAQDDDGYPTPLVNINARAITIAGLLTTLAVIVIPLILKPHPSLRRRSEGDSDWFGDVMNEVLLRNGYVTPCTQRIVCSLISRAVHTENPTSAEKIIDGISSHRWFEEMVEGTAIQDAVAAGRQTERNCAHQYKGCFFTPRFLGALVQRLSGQ